MFTSITTWFYLIFVTYITKIHSQCNAPTFSGIEFRLTSEQNTDSDDDDDSDDYNDQATNNGDTDVHMLVYNDFTIYQCLINPTTENKYHSCPIENDCCIITDTYCNSINNGRLIIENPTSDPIIVEEINVLTTNNVNDCNINHPIVNWCINNEDFNTLPIKQQNKDSGLSSHCTTTQTHVTALYLLPSSIIETNFLHGDFTSRLWMDTYFQNIQKPPCSLQRNTTSASVYSTTTQSQHAHTTPDEYTSVHDNVGINSDALAITSTYGVLLSWSVVYVIAIIAFLMFLFCVYMVYNTYKKSNHDNELMEMNLEMNALEQNGISNVKSETIDMSNTNGMPDLETTIIFAPNEMNGTVILETIHSNLPVTLNLDIEGQNNHEKSVLGMSINVNEFESQTKQQSHHMGGILNDSVTVTETNNIHIQSIAAISRIDTLENILIDVMNKDIPENSEFDHGYGEEKSMTVPVMKHINNNIESMIDSNECKNSITIPTATSSSKHVNNNTESMSANDDINIKLIFYDFDQTITAIHLYKELNGQNVNELEKSNERLIEIFGGNDRMVRLHKHFNFLISKNIKLAVLSFGYVKAIDQALSQMDMLKYFSFIVGRDSECMKQSLQKKEVCIKNFMRIHNYNKNEILFVDDDPLNIELVDKYCQTLLIQPRIGMRENHFEYIENTYVH